MKQFKYNIVAVFGMLICGFGFAQQSVPVYESYFISEKMLINPSFAGDSEDVKAKVYHRQQWKDIDNGPETTVASVHGNIIDRVGLGMYFAADQNGNTKVNSLNLAAAYHIPIGEPGVRQDGQFSFGTSLSFSGFRFGGVTEIPNDPLYDGETNVFIPYINFGGSVQYKGWMAGVSVLDLALAYNEPMVNELEPSPVYFYGMAGKKLRLAESFELEPVLMYRFNKDERKQLDANLRAKFFSGNNAFWAGANYRHDMSGDQSEGLSISPMLGAELGRLNFGFAYNIGLTDIATEGGDGWSISLGYDIDNFFKPGKPTIEE
ncbi:type IX secretion system membrane protein PorP/SprF [Weeksellaceae bacterium KMM 9713]|uniref:Type IX secretion system membrane protein PorP/SprF n=1 Tax=Profundicola chukchiensis TaxID=2961959 RepID=A0A9X4N0I2_9FLAO|nr:type IX secretion system membrane protein PorP/SprF [Profundicola chukchiensis]MDG4946487.1 type IX secretion system membrane protein PorP/SprF [Profundicola chukchiensis]MDG4950707.1 type IX secretion system membrane protein PorP/SprF [Profundicola chukchiensis]